MAAVYFRRLEVVGREHLPRAGPVLLAANHPLSLTDAFLLVLGAGRMVRFLAHSGLFARPIQGALLRAAGVIPIYRSQDVAEAREKNVQAFRAVTEALAAGGMVGIFPEGVSREERRLQPLKTGAARMALEAEAAHEFRLGLRIVPAGILFESRRRFRSRVLLSFGEPLVAGDYRDAYLAEPHEAAHRLTEDLGRRLEALVVHVERSELEPLVERVERVYRGRLLERFGPGGGSGSDPGPDPPSRFAREQALSREIARAADFAREHDPLLLWRVQSLVTDYERKLERLRVSDETLGAARPPSLGRAGLRYGLIAGLGFPVALYGAAWNVLPYRLAGRLAAAKAADETKVHWYQAAYGTGLYLLYYPPLLFLAYRAVGTLPAALFAASLLPTGLFARWYAGRVRRAGDWVRFALLSATKGYYVQELRVLRARVRAEMDRAAERILDLRASEAPEPKESS